MDIQLFLVGGSIACMAMGLFIRLWTIPYWQKKKSDDIARHINAKEHDVEGYLQIEPFYNEQVKNDRRWMWGVFLVGFFLLVLAVFLQ